MLTPELNRLETSQKEALSFFNKAKSNHYLKGTYLLEGVKGTPKEALAKYVAMMYLCEQEGAEPCGECSHCKRIMADEDPAVYTIKPENNTINLAKIEELYHEFSLSGLESEKRVFIIESMELMAISSSQKLLKFLEELPEHTLGLMTVSNAKMVLPTILSRVQTVRLHQDTLEDKVNLALKEGLNEGDSLLLATYASTLDNVQTLSHDEGMLCLMNVARDIASDLLDKPEMAMLTLKKHKKMIERYLEDDLMDDKETLSTLLDLEVIFYQSMQAYNSNPKAPNAFKALFDDKGTYMNSMDMAQAMETILKYKERLRYNVNVEIQLMSMFLELRG